MTVYRCPVCGFDMRYPPRDYAICSCCGTEFGYDDYAMSHADLRAQWIAAGCPWFSAYTPPPDGWSAERQVARLEHRT